jgi:hypothetical protein
MQHRLGRSRLLQGISLSSPSARINRASATALRSDRLRFRAVLAWLWPYLAWRTQIPRSIRCRGSDHHTGRVLWLTIGEPQTGPALRWISAAKKTSVGAVTSGVHLLDRQVRDAHSVRMAPRMILSCPTSLWPRDSDRHSTARNPAQCSARRARFPARYPASSHGTARDAKHCSAPGRRTCDVLLRPPGERGDQGYSSEAAGSGTDCSHGGVSPHWWTGVGQGMTPDRPRSRWVGDLSGGHRVRAASRRLAHGCW